MVEIDDFFFQYTEEELFEELKADWMHGHIHSQRRVWDKKLGHVRITEVTLELLESEMWCKQCQKKKAELYPNL
jgi:hypothetical protein